MYDGIYLCAYGVNEKILSLSLSLSFSVISINFICFISFGLCVALTTQKEMKYYKSENYRFCFKRKTQLA